MRGEGVVELNHREESLRLPSPGRFAPPGGCCAGTEWWNVCKMILECVTTHVYMKKEITWKTTITQKRLIPVTRPRTERTLT